MMKRLLPLLLLLFAFPLHATDTTAELLQSPLIKERAVFQVTADGKLQVALDRSATFNDVSDGDAFLLSQQRDLTFRDFNPFKYTIKTNQTTEKDPNFGSIATLLDALQKMAEGAGAPSAALSATAKAARFQADRFEWQSALARIQAIPAPATDCDEYEKLREAFARLDFLTRDPIVSPTDFKALINDANSATKVGDARKAIDTMIKNLGDNVKDLETADAAIRDKFLPKPSSESSKTPLEQFVEAVAGKTACNRMQPVVFALVYDTARHLASSLEAKRALITSLTDLNKSLKPYEDPSKWRIDHPGEYIFLQPKPDFNNIIVVSVTVTTRSIGVDDTPALKSEDAGSVARSIRIRLYSQIVPELSGAVIKTDLKFPKYGVNNTTNKIESAGTDDFPASGAVALNGVFRLGRTSFVYPMLQLGVTNSKDYPGFILGGGLRFTNPRPLSVVAGYIYTWTKDLVDAKVGDTVTGTADLEKHLQRKGKRGSYIGIQYSF
jgi:hypothetical protein